MLGHLPITCAHRLKGCHLPVPTKSLYWMLSVTEITNQSQRSKQEKSQTLNKSTNRKIVDYQTRKPNFKKEPSRQYLIIKQKLVEPDFNVMHSKPNTANDGSRSRNSSASKSHKSKDVISVKGTHDYIHFAGDPKSDYGSNF